MLARVWVGTDWLLFANAEANKPNPSPIGFRTDVTDSAIFSVEQFDSLVDSVCASNMLFLAFKSSNATLRKL